jgi:magnesium transporter
MTSYPAEAAHWLETMPINEIAKILVEQPIEIAVRVWDHIPLDIAEGLIEHLPEQITTNLLSKQEPTRCAALLRRLFQEIRERLLTRMPDTVAKDLRMLLEYSEDSAGGLMDPRFSPFRTDTSVNDALARIRQLKRRDVKEVFLVDRDGKLSGKVSLQAMALADPDISLDQISKPVEAAVQDIAPREEVAEKLEVFKMSNLPVVDFDGRLIGVIRQTGLVEALQQQATLDLQTMVGAGKEERALSKISFTLRKRLPWLQINLLTAFLAASVVALFEETIARFTALAVLLPVVAGQSGNAGAQALAVTMRGLAVREISVRHWPRVVFKEVGTGLLNGIAVALTTMMGVMIWSRSWGLVLVIGISMVIAMVAAGFSGAIIPITLKRLGQDPAQSSSIILTTITDVVGFFTFLGMASLLAGLL